MWNKPWKMGEGFAIGGGMIALGLVLQFVCGPIDWDFFAWPVNLAAMAAILVMIALMFAFRKKVHLFEWMMHYGAAVPSLVYALWLTLIMGLTVQTDRGGVPWLSQMLSFWPFAIIWSWVAIVSGLAALNHAARLKIKEIPFVLNHLGIFLALTAATLGSADVRSLEMSVKKGVPQRLALDDEDGSVQEMDFAIDLKSFTIEEYPPKLIAVSRTTGKRLPYDDKLQRSMEKKRYWEDLDSGWRIHVIKVIDEAAPYYPEEDIIGDPLNRKLFVYAPSTEEGAVSAAFVEATKE